MKNLTSLVIIVLLVLIASSCRSPIEAAIGPRCVRVNPSWTTESPMAIEVCAGVNNLLTAHYVAR